MILKTLGLVVTLAVGVLAAPLAAEGQQAGKVYRIGWLGITNVPYLTDVFVQRMRELGYREGQNIVIERRYVEGKPERFPEFAAELVRLKPDLIVAVTTLGVQAVQQATRKIPIVMVAVADPVASGFVASLARPGGNITGQSYLSAELSGKRLELLKEVVPGVSRVAALWNPTNPSSVLQIGATEVAAQALGLRLQPLEVRGPQDFESAFQAATRGRAGALITVDDPLTFAHRAQIVALAAKSRLPAIYGSAVFAEAGGLITYAANAPEMFRQTVVFVDKILKGAKPADLPVEQPTRFELVINMKTAKELGLTIPPSVLIRADKVIE